MLSMGSFGARVDVPPADHIDDMVQALLEPAQRYNVRQVAFLIFNDEDNTDLKQAITGAFGDGGINIVAALEVGDGKCREFTSQDWQDFDIAAHPFTLEAQYDGLAPRHNSRSDMWEDIRPQSMGWHGEVATATRELYENGPAATVITLTREDPKAQAELWKAALRGAEPGSEAAATIAIVTGYALWLSGDGASAWLVLDNMPGDTKLHKGLAGLLSDAINPADWPF